MNTVAKKLKTKDLIVAGAFAALYVAMLMIGVSVLGFIPILYIMAPFFVSILLGPIYMLYVAKVPKPGAIMILAAATGLLTSMGGVWIALVWSLLIGLAAQLIAHAGRYQSRKMYRISYCVFACTNMGPFWALVLMKESFLATAAEYYGPEYAASVAALTPPWIIFALIGIALLGGLLGGALGARLLKKHFEKAGVV
ncbi:MptD family putative ECF transporter S component [Oscillospiraceae bacterium OttesenSCG-928-F05]|nr:MptD family putative ECF transporter S component [Oscillospiraceae bacterium OttesenSCG-928-F05]